MDAIAGELIVMRDQYAGDISDFFKFSFLRAVVPDDAVLGVAWYYVQRHDGGPDGRQIEYWSEDRWRVLDPHFPDGLVIWRPSARILV